MSKIKWGRKMEMVGKCFRVTGIGVKNKKNTIVEYIELTGIEELHGDIMLSDNNYNLYSENYLLKRKYKKKKENKNE